MVVNIVDNLKSLGLTDYEAKTYQALVIHHPATAYETAKACGIPTSKIYEVLSRLTLRGLVMETGDPGKKTYTPLAPQEMLQREKRHLNQVFDTLEEDFRSLSLTPAPDQLWNLSRPEDFRRRAQDLVKEAQESLLISVWEEELHWIQGSLQEARTRGVRTAAVLFGETAPQDLGQVYLHPIRDTLHAERGGRGFVLVADHCQVLWGTFTASALEGIWSRSGGFVTLAEDYVKHDIYIMKLVKRYGADMLRRFGPGFKKLRDIFADQEDL